MLNNGSYGLFENIRLNEGSIPNTKSSTIQLYPNLGLNANKVIVEFENTGTFYISNGNQIVYNFIANKLSFNDYLHSFITGLLLFQRGHLLLHGNSCIWTDQHIAFCGESGVGKSSLAAQFHKNGALFFCDEIICFDKLSNITLPGFPFLRLWKNDLDYNKFNSSLVSKLWNNEEKYKLDTSSQRVDVDKELDILIYLETDDSLNSPQLKEVTGTEKVTTFWSSYYQRPVIDSIELTAQFNQQSFDILKTLRVFKLKRPNHKESRLECFELIKKALK